LNEFDCLKDNPPNPCGSNPCRNGGVCQNFGHFFTCKCPLLYFGKYCEESKL